MNKLIVRIVGVLAVCAAAAFIGYVSLRSKPLPPEAVNEAMAKLLAEVDQPTQADKPDYGQGTRHAEPAVVPDTVPAAAAAKRQDAVDTQSEAKEKYEKSIPQASPTPRLDLNAATLEQLMDLPGIGESKAKAIAQLRARLGRFGSVEQLKDVKGIGDKIFEKVQPLVHVGGP